MTPVIVIGWLVVMAVVYMAFEWLGRYLHRKAEQSARLFDREYERRVPERMSTDAEPPPWPGGKEGRWPR